MEIFILLIFLSHLEDGGSDQSKVGQEKFQQTEYY